MKTLAAKRFRALLMAIAYEARARVYQTRYVSGRPVHAAYVQIIWAIVVIIVSLLVSYAMRQKPQNQEPAKGNVPTVKDGKSIIRIYGTVWVDDSIVLGWKPVGTDPIKKKGGKK